MKLKICLSIIGLLFFSSISWSAETEFIPQYGLFEISFQVDIPYKNPYFSSDIRVDALITTPAKEQSVVPCFYYANGSWHLRYTPSLPGTYQYSITADNGSTKKEVLQGTFPVKANDQKGFVRISRNNPRIFAFDNGHSYFPVGEDLAWVSGNKPELYNELWKKYLDECQQAGMDWIRIWMCSWGMTELTWKKNGTRYFGFEEYSGPNALLIDELFQMAEERGVYIQWCINHHGQYSTTVNPNWNDNPYNTANGGFLNTPGEFFTSETSAAHYKDRLRYIVGRWGYSTHLMAWEFFNEVDLTSYKRWDDVTAWHDKMSAYLRSLDPYHHLQTSSVSWGPEKLFPVKGLDYLQSHAYVTDIIGTQQSISKRVKNAEPLRPHFFGEMSSDASGPASGDTGGVVLHNQLWSSIHSWDAGTAMTWWWDSWVRPYNLYPQFTVVKKYIQGIDWAAEPMQPMAADIVPKPGNRGDFSFTPKLGWGTTKVKEFTIHADGTIDQIDQCSQFIHGMYHPAMAPNPIFDVTVEASVQFGMTVATIAKAGAIVSIEIDGATMVKKEFKAGDKDYDPGVDGKFQVDVPAGNHKIRIRNTGKDWYMAGSFWLTNFIQRPEVFARGNSNRVLVWVHDRPYIFSLLDRYSQFNQMEPTELILPELTKGVYKAEFFDPYTGEIRGMDSIAADAGGLRLPVPGFLKDVAFRLIRTDTGLEWNVY